MADVLAKQRPDGGFRLRDLGSWTSKDGSAPREESDGYATAFTVYVLKELGSPDCGEAVELPPSTGDADVAHHAGVPYELGDGHGDALYPSTMFRVGGVDAGGHRDRQPRERTGAVEAAAAPPEQREGRDDPERDPPVERHGPEAGGAEVEFASFPAWKPPPSAATAPIAPIASDGTTMSVTPLPSASLGSALIHS